MPLKHQIAHLSNLHLNTPVLDQSVAFFVDYLGLSVKGESDGAVYLRCWDDYEQHTIVLSQNDTAGIRRTHLRAASADALAGLVQHLEGTGRVGEWQDGAPGYGPTYVFHDPDGHELGVYWESERYVGTGADKPALKNQAQAYPGRGVSVRRLDHINYLGRDVEANRDFFRDDLGALVTEQIVLDDASIAGSWTTFTNKGYDAVYTRDRTGSTGRLHHIAFATDNKADIIRAADIALEQGVFIETGPHKHAIQQTFFLYIYEPGGNRIELCNAGARLVLDPDWQPINWTEAERAKGQAWGLKTIESFHTHGTPPVDEA
jgi:catechol 2,3-dioxygenase